MPSTVLLTNHRMALSPSLDFDFGMKQNLQKVAKGKRRLLQDGGVAAADAHHEVAEGTVDVLTATLES